MNTITKQLFINQPLLYIYTHTQKWINYYLNKLEDNIGRETKKP